MNELRETMERGLSFGAGREEESGPVVGVAPLVDIILLLICFYLLISRFIQNYEDPEVLLPTMSEQQSQEMARAEVVVNLREDGTVRVNQEVLEMEALPGVLAGELARGGEANLVIRADRRQEYGQLERVLHLSREAGWSQAALRMRDEEVAE